MKKSFLLSTALVMFLISPVFAQSQDSTSASSDSTAINSSFGVTSSVAKKTGSADSSNFDVVSTLTPPPAFASGTVSVEKSVRMCNQNHILFRNYLNPNFGMTRFVSFPDNPEINDLGWTQAELYEIWGSLPFYNGTSGLSGDSNVGGLEASEKLQEFRLKSVLIRKGTSLDTLLLRYGGVPINLKVLTDFLISIRQIMITRQIFVNNGFFYIGKYGFFDIGNNSFFDIDTQTLISGVLARQLPNGLFEDNRAVIYTGNSSIRPISYFPGWTFTNNFVLSSSDGSKTIFSTQPTYTPFSFGSYTYYQHECPPPPPPPPPPETTGDSSGGNN